MSLSFTYFSMPTDLHYPWRLCIIFDVAHISHWWFPETNWVVWHIFWSLLRLSLGRILVQELTVQKLNASFMLSATWNIFLRLNRIYSSEKGLVNQMMFYIILHVVILLVVIFHKLAFFLHRALQNLYTLVGYTLHIWHQSIHFLRYIGNETEPHKHNFFTDDWLLFWLAQTHLLRTTSN